MNCKQVNGKLVFEGDLNYTLNSDPAWPDDPEKAVVEYMVVQKIFSDRASGSGWTSSVLNQLSDRMRQLEHKLMELAVKNIKIKG